MRLALAPLVCSLALLTVAGFADPPKPGAPLPSGHPPLSPLPRGHPPTTRPALPPGHPPATQPALPAGHPPMTAPRTPADTGDTATPLLIVQAYYGALSGPVGAPRDWERFESLFFPGARLMTVNSGANGDVPLVLSPEQFTNLNRKYFEGAGYVEQSIHERREEFAHVAHVWSTYEARRGGAAGAPYSRGITSFQLVLANERWWIAGVVWDRESGGARVPAEYLPAGGP